MINKSNLIRLRGKDLRVLVAKVFERDNHECVVCGAWVESGIKPHHEPCGAGRKSDELNKMVLLCNQCHYERHHGKNLNLYREKIENYLKKVNEQHEL